MLRGQPGVNEGVVLLGQGLSLLGKCIFELEAFGGGVGNRFEDAGHELKHWLQDVYKICK